MLHLLYVAVSLFLSLRFAVADPASILRLFSNPHSSRSKSQLSVLLVRRGSSRASDVGCPAGYLQCTNYPSSCALSGYFCCNDSYTCPDGNTCYGYNECCPNNSQTCGGSTCCNAGSECCTDTNSCCDTGSFCCNDSAGGCCPNGSTCIPNSNYCTYSSGGGSGGGGSSLVTTSIKSIVQPGSTSVSITFNGPTTSSSLSTHSSSSSPTPSSSGTSTSGLSLPSTGAAPRGIALTPGRQLAALVAVMGILHNVAHRL